MISTMSNVQSKSASTEKELKTVSLALGAAQTQLKVSGCGSRFT